MVSIGTNNGKDIWSNAELANKLGVPASRINKQTCMVSAMNGDLHATSSLAFAWINDGGGLSVQAGTAGAYRFDIHVLFVGL